LYHINTNNNIFLLSLRSIVVLTFHVSTTRALSGFIMTYKCHTPSILRALVLRVSRV